LRFERTLVFLAKIELTPLEIPNVSNFAKLLTLKHKKQIFLTGLRQDNTKIMFETADVPKC